LDTLNPPTIANLSSAAQYRFTIANVNQMADAGILDPAVRFELWDGQLLLMSPFKVPGSEAHSKLVELFYAHRPGSDVQIRAEKPIDIADPYFLPEPDISLTDANRESRKHQHPGARDIYLVVEISDTTRNLDLAKVAKYATAQICEYWIVDVPDQEVTVYRKPRQGSYQSTATRKNDDLITVEALPGMSFKVSDIFA
jgi:Uma2 family endonuclease